MFGYQPIRICACATLIMDREAEVEGEKDRVDQVYLTLIEV